MFNIVLLEPEIPSNTGNIGRTCLIANARLHLIEPMGFILNDKNLKRAGMDYWQELDVTVYDCLNDFFELNREKLAAPYGSGSAALWMATTKARRLYTGAGFKEGDYIMFGKESAGIPESLLKENREGCIRIPMASGQRSLNLANSAAIVLYEALRQNDFKGLEPFGQLHESEW